MTSTSSFLGIDRYLKFEVLDYDVIHHIDMHMQPRLMKKLFCGGNTPKVLPMAHK